MGQQIRHGCEGSHEHDQTEHICGRPLGLCFNQTTCDLYIVDAYGAPRCGPRRLLGYYGGDMCTCHSIWIYQWLGY
ncbi:unnamed protein product [Malus baccata var. baccata]